MTDRPRPRYFGCWAPNSRPWVARARSPRGVAARGGRARCFPPWAASISRRAHVHRVRSPPRVYVNYILSQGLRMCTIRQGIQLMHIYYSYSHRARATFPTCTYTCAFYPCTMKALMIDCIHYYMDSNRNYMSCSSLSERSSVHHANT